MLEVVAVSRMDALKIILEHEYLKTLGAGAMAFYGLKLDGELLAVEVLGTGGSHQARNISGLQYVPQTINLMRGAHVPHAPRFSPSYLISRACRLAYRDFGWEIFFSYADPNAEEIGTVYQAANWHYIGCGLGRRRYACHINWLAPDGKTITSNNRTKRRKLEMYAAGCTPVASLPKHKYVHFEGPRKHLLAAQCRFPFLPYPKRATTLL
jgi:hypothetical protein